MSRKAIWRTDDGKDIYDGDLIHCLEYSIPYQLYVPIVRIAKSEYGHPPVQQYSTSNKYFSTVELAKKYQLEHHKGLSIDQVIKALGLKRNDKRINNLKEIIKSELKC